jgi:predicted nucleotidyltransferase
MRAEHPLDDLFSSRSHVRVLRALYELPEGLAVSARDIGRRASVSHPMASRVLASLAEQGLARRARVSRADLFELNSEHVAADALRVLFDWERQVEGHLLAFLREVVDREAPAVSGAYLFGSAARGEAGPRSDVDVAVLCAPRHAEAVEAAMDRVAEAVRARYGARLNVLMATEPLESLLRPGRRGRRLWGRIAAEGVPLIRQGRRERRRA